MKIKASFFEVKKNLSIFWFQIKNKKSHIPDFNIGSNTFRVLIISYLIFLLFNIAISSSFDELNKKLVQNFLVFTPYLLVEIIILLISARIIKRLNAALAISYMFLSVFISSYITFSFASGNLILNMAGWEAFSLKFLQSLSILFFFIIYFDWKIRAMNPLEDIAKLSFLQSKMDPHFLFNCLNTVNYLIKKDPKTAQKMIVNLSDLIRVSLVQKELLPIITIEQELELVDKYLEIEKLRLCDRLVIEKEVENKTLKKEIPQFLIQPLIENAIKHGIQTTTQCHPIKLKVYCDLSDNLIVEIKNHYSNQVTLDIASNGISIKNLQERINLYYQGRGELRINQGTNEYHVYIKLPSKIIALY